MSNDNRLTQRGMRGQGRGIDPQRLRRNARLGTTVDMGKGIRTDKNGRLEVVLEDLDIPTVAEVNDNTSRIGTLEAALKAAGLL